MIKTGLSAEKPVSSAEYQVLSGARATQHSALCTRNSLLSTQHSALGSQYSALSTQHFHRGFTLLELIAVISIIAILAGLFLTRVPYYQERAEKAAMQQVEGALQSALVLRYGSLLTRGAANEQQLGQLATDNPMNWLQQKPQNYSGEFYDPTPGAVAPGHWMFDLRSRDLIYVLDRTEFFTPGRDGKKWIRFHVSLGYEPALGKPDSGKELVSTLFVPVEPYHWLD